MPNNHVRETQEALTTQVLAAMSENPTGWAKPWREILTHTPHNATTGKAYQGGNVLYLAMVQMAKGYPTTRWATYKQWESVGAQVRKGEKGTAMVKWGRTVCKGHSKDESCDKCGRMYASAFTVFNAEQVDGWVAPVVEELTCGERFEVAERWFAAVGAGVVEGGDRACYSPVTDRITVPRFAQFVDGAAYYATLAHEHAHWTGHESRLNRDLAGRFGSESYAVEELVAELTAVFVCAELGVAAVPREDHAAYLASWLKVLKSDVKALWRACSEAQKALGFMVGEVESRVAVAA